MHRTLCGLTVKTLGLRRTVWRAASLSITTRVARMTNDKGVQQRWLLKTEPNEWSWGNQEANSGLSVWDGVRNLQAQNLMKTMIAGDLCFFYHTGKLKEVAGIVRVEKTFYPDPTDASGKLGAVDVREVRAFKCPVTLAQMKDDDHFKDFKMLKQPRLSIVPVDEGVWERICELGEGESANSQGVKEGKKNSGGVKKIGKKEVKKVENLIPPKGAKVSNKKSKGSETDEMQLVDTTNNGSGEKKGGKTKRGGKGVNDEQKGTKPSDSNGAEGEEVSNKKSKGSKTNEMVDTIDNGSGEKKGGKTKRGGKGVNDEQKSTKPSDSNGAEGEEVTVGNTRNSRGTSGLRSGGEKKALVVPEVRARANTRANSREGQEKRVSEAEKAAAGSRTPQKRKKKRTT